MISVPKFTCMSRASPEKVARSNRASLEKVAPPNPTVPGELHIAEVDVLEMSCAKVEVACCPAVFGLGPQVIGDDADDGGTDFAVVLPVLEVLFVLRASEIS